MILKSIFLLLLPLALAAPACAQEAETVVHMLDYIAVDYPGVVRDGAVLNEREYDEQLEFAREAARLIAKLPRRPASETLARNVSTLHVLIEEKAPGHRVSHAARELRGAIIAAYEIAVAPKRPPDVTAAKSLYATLCASCHGAQGHGDGPAVSGMKPPPTDFHDAAPMSERSVYALYSTISLGVSGTPMPAFPSLAEDQRWALAFHVGALHNDAASIEKGRVLWDKGEARGFFRDLRQVSMLTESEARARGGDAGAAVLAYLRSRPQSVTERAEAPLEVAVRLLDESLAARRAGDAERAYRLALTAYLEGFEPAEAPLDTVDRALRAEIEAQMTAFRDLVRASGALEPVEAQHGRVRTLLKLAGQKLAGAEVSPGSLAFAAALIILREGLEAILVVAAILAFAARSGRPAARRYVHAGWLGAVALGIATWAVASTVIEISGADRELTEGLTALAASAMLLYVGYWLHEKTHAEAWTTYIRERAVGALGSSALWSLATLSFLAVYREMFEVVLFYEALLAQAGGSGLGAVVGGTAAGAALLVAAGLLILRFGLRLPVGPFFSACTVLLLALAVSFAGQGVAKLQAAGAVRADAVPIPRLPLLGLYPTLQTLAAQIAVLALIAAAFAWRRARKCKTRDSMADLGSAKDPSRRHSLRGFVALLCVAIATTLPALLLRLEGWAPNPFIDVLLFGMAILAAGFMLSWSAETAERRFSPGLILAVVALITVLPEYAVDIYYALQAGRDPQSNYVHYAAANMTGANRLLIGFAWPLLVLLHWRRSGERAIALGQAHAIELAFLLAASLYGFVIVWRGHIGILDAAALIALYALYLWRVSRERKPEEDGEEEEPGPASALKALKPAAQWSFMAALAVFAVAVILASAEPFAEAMVGAGRRLGMDEFLLIQWLAPLASEAPAVTLVVLFVLAGRAANGLSTMISDKINQWTLLVGMLPLAMSVGAGALVSLPLDARQHEEFFLTTAQSLFGLALLLPLRLGVWGALALAMLFSAQLALAFSLQGDEARTVRALTGFAWIYIALAAALFAVQWRSLVRIVKRAFSMAAS